jgi:transposase
MLVELRVGEQRLRAVWEVLDGASVTEVARRFGVSRQSVHVWLRRYAADQGLGDRSSRPHGCPHQMSPVTEAKIVEIRRAHPVWGADRIGYQLTRDGVSPVPGRTSIYRALLRNGLVVPGSGSGGGRSIGGGNGPDRWSCGRWTWSAASTWPMAPS